MLVSLKWLRDYVDVDVSPAELAERLTMAGLEVDSLKEPGPPSAKSGWPRSSLSNPIPMPIIYPSVKSQQERQPILSSAAPGISASATPSPWRWLGRPCRADMSSGVRRIRGEASEGMLCSEEELGIGGDASGIMILPSDLPLGEELAEVLDLRDTVLDIGVTPNRADCLSIIGVARELAAITGKELRYPATGVIETDEDIRGITSVSILDPDLCPRYTARIIKGVRIGPSPLWMPGGDPTAAWFTRAARTSRSR